MVGAFDSRSRVWVRALGADIVFCSWVRHFYSHSASVIHPSGQMGTAELKAEGNPALD